MLRKCCEWRLLVIIGMQDVRKAYENMQSIQVDNAF